MLGPLAWCTREDARQRVHHPVAGASDRAGNYCCIDLTRLVRVGENDRMLVRRSKFQRQPLEASLRQRLVTGTKPVLVAAAVFRCVLPTRDSRLAPLPNRARRALRQHSAAEVPLRGVHRRVVCARIKHFDGRATSHATRVENRSTARSAPRIVLREISQRPWLGGLCRSPGRSGHRVSQRETKEGYMPGSLCATSAR